MFLKYFNRKYWLYGAVHLALLLGSSSSFADFSWFKHAQRNFQESVERCLFPKNIRISYKENPEKEVKVKIITPTFILRTFKNRDIDFLKSIYQNPLLMKTLMINGQPFSDQQLDCELRSWEEKKRTSAFTVYIMEDKEKRYPIGVFELLPKKDVLEVSYIISQPFQGQGWGSKLMNTVMKDLIPLLKKASALKSNVGLIGYALQDNFASLKILKAAGFVPKVVKGNGGLPSNWELFEFPL